MWGSSRFCPWPSFILIIHDDVLKSSKELSFHLFADDTTLTYAHKNPRVLESTVNLEFAEVSGMAETQQADS